MVLFAAGFRPFFLLAGLQAVAAMVGWLVFYFGSGTLPHAFSPVLWHAHELVFGFGIAAVTGFLLTAVPNWTGTKPRSGAPVAVLAGLWLAGRLGFWFSSLLPAWLVAVLDLAFLPVLAFLVAQPLLAAGKLRNIIFLPILGMFWFGELLVQMESVAGTDTGMAGVRLGIWVLILMITIIGGRIVPAFTANWMRATGSDGQVRTSEMLDRIAPILVAIAAAGDILIPASPATGAVLLVAAAAQAWRLAGWQGLKTLSQPILWVLHVGYAWVVIGLALRGLAVYVPASAPPSAALHALTAGAIATMILGVMTRAALGHSGRPLQVSTAVAWAYGLLTISAFIRVFGPIVHPSTAGDLVPAVSGGIWIAAFLIYVAVYWPICTRPRADGRPG